MGKMKVLAIKMSGDPHSMRVVYEKDGKTFMRTGEDGFESGRPLKAPLPALLNKWGFRKVDNPPEFRDSEELVDGLTGFELKNSGTVVYNGR